MNTSIYPCVSLISKSEGLCMECRSGSLKKLKALLLQLVSGKAMMPILQTSILLHFDAALRFLFRMIHVPQYFPFLLNKSHQFKPTHGKTHVQCYYSFNGLNMRMGELWVSEFSFIFKRKDLMRRKFGNTALFEAAYSSYLRA